MENNRICKKMLRETCQSKNYGNYSDRVITVWFSIEVCSLLELTGTPCWERKGGGIKLSSYIYSLWF